jgi:hypothetical protein
MRRKNQKPPICIGGSEKPRVMDAPPLHERTFSRTLPHKRGRCRAVIGMGFSHHYLYLIFTVTSFLKFVNTQKWWLVFGVPTMQRSNAHHSRPIQRPNGSLCDVTLLRPAPAAELPFSSDCHRQTAAHIPRRCIRRSHPVVRSLREASLGY